MIADSIIGAVTFPGTVLAPGPSWTRGVTVDASPAWATVTLARAGLT